MTRRSVSALVILIVIIVVGCAKPEPTEDELSEQTMRVLRDDLIPWELASLMPVLGDRHGRILSQIQFFCQKP